MLASTDNYQILIDTKADNKGVKDTETALRDLSGETDKSHNSFLKLSAAVAVGEAAFNMARIGIQKLTGFVKESIDAQKESEDLMAQTAAVLASTGGAAGVTAQQITQLATAMQKSTRFSDEQVRSAENLMLTFTAVGKNIFPDATKAALDMATALHEDVQSSVIRLGKALQDPIGGLTALKKAGVNVNETFKDHIKVLVEAGKTEQAQKEILKELSTEFGGSAEAAGHTFAGSLDKLKNSFNDVQESIGKTIIDGITPFVQKAADFVAAVDWAHVIEVSKNALMDLYKWLDNAWHKIDEVYQAIEKYLGPKLKSLGKSLEDIFPVLKRFAEQYILPVVEALGPIVGKGVVWAIGIVIDGLKDLVKIAEPVFKFLDDHKLIVYALAGAFGALALSMALGAALDAITIGFTTFQLVTIPSLMTSLGMLGAAFVAAVPVLAVGLALGAIILKYQETMKVIDETNAHINASLGNIDQANRKLDEMANKGQVALDYAYRVQQSTGGVSTISKQTIQGMPTYLPKFASGTDYAPGGKALVGEQGPEIIDLPRGSQVHSASESKQMMNSHTVTIGTVVLGNSGAVDRFFEKLDQDAILTGKGLTPVRGGY